MNTISSVILHRTLTRKSKLGFGKWKNLTIQQLIDLGKKEVLIAPYFKLSSIDYTEDILKELKITPEFRMRRGETDKVKYLEFLKKYYPKNLARDKEGADKMKFETRAYTKTSLQYRNQGH